MKKTIKNRSQRRGTQRKFNVIPNGFRSSSRTNRLLQEFYEITQDPNKHEGEWVSKNIKSIKDVLGFPSGLRKVMMKLLNQKKLNDYLELEQIIDPVQGKGIKVFKNKNEDPKKLVTYMNLLSQVMEDELEITGEISTSSRYRLSHSSTTDMMENSKYNYFLKIYKNMVSFRSDEIQFDLTSCKDGVEIHTIDVKKRFNGLGKSFLRVLQLVSEFSGIPVYLFPIDHRRVFNGGTNGLKDWYSRNGIPQLEDDLPIHGYIPTNEYIVNLPEVPNEILESSNFNKTEFMDLTDELKELLLQRGPNNKSKRLVG